MGWLWPYGMNMGWIWAGYGMDMPVLGWLCLVRLLDWATLAASEGSAGRHRPERPPRGRKR